jgi:hypothetical protein
MSCVVLPRTTRQSPRPGEADPGSGAATGAFGTSLLAGLDVGAVLLTIGELEPGLAVADITVVKEPTADHGGVSRVG